jgi:predicted dehydrogenase
VKGGDADDTAILIGKVGAGALLSMTGTWAARQPPAFTVDAYGDAGTLHLDASAHLFGARHGEELHELLPAINLPAVAGEHRFVPLFGRLAGELVSAVAHGRSRHHRYATFEDGVRLQEVMDLLRGQLAQT